MLTEELDYELPETLIATRPTSARDGARMLVVEASGLSHNSVSHWPELVPSGALVVVNDSAVIKARLLGAKQGTGGRVELLLVRCLESSDANGEEEIWEALGRASKGLRAGTLVDFLGLQAEILGEYGEGSLAVRLRASGGVTAALDRVGHVPIPPYLRREDEPDDAVRYQTVYAAVRGSVAAPTAGLHLTVDALSRLKRRGVEVVSVTLHVGIGTFRPVTVPDLNQHVMHRERMLVNSSLEQAIVRARARSAPVIAVGTTVVRALESARDPHRPGHVCTGERETNLLIQPGYSFSIVDGLLTNFHQPRSTLMALVSAFVGTARIREAYSAAIQSGYRFLSYGDAMWLPQRLG